MVRHFRGGTSVQSSLCLTLSSLALIALTFGAPSVAWAQPDFTRSTLTHVPAAVAEGDVVTFTATVRNDGTEDAPYTEVDIGLPVEAMFVDAEGIDGAAVDPLLKQISITVPASTGSERRFSFRLVVPRDAGGHTLTPMLRVRYAYRNLEFTITESIDVETRLGSGGVRVGPVRVSGAGLVLLAVLALYPVLWFGLPRHRRSHGAVFPIVLAVGFWTMFAGMAWRDRATLSSWRESSCTVLDKRMREVTASSNIARGRTLPRTANRQFKPLLAVRYLVDGAPTLSTGYETGSRVTVGRGASVVDEYETWAIGSTIPCWFNPEDPGELVVVRGFGGAYLFALIPVPVFALGILGLRRSRPRRS